jgi:hypothetical protein
VDGKNFNPVSLAPFFLIILERMMNCRLSWWLEHNKKLPDPQFRLRKNKLCLDSLSLIYSHTVNTFDNDKIVGAVFMDIKAAYDNVLQIS